MDQRVHKAYIDALKQEIEYYGELYNNKYYVDTVFIGGGTPSIVDEALTAELLEAVRAAFQVQDDAEITIEANPKTLTKEKLERYRKAGMNRISMGVQSLNDQLLQFMGRIHKAEDVLLNYRQARECGFDNINLDLMFAIPGQTMEIWKTTLSRIIDLEPEHISFYGLQLEEGTPFYQMFLDGKMKEISDELDRNMYYQAIEMLKDSGYIHYEISNAAKDGYYCRHNLKYWSMEDYLGLGLGAHSFLNGMRFNNQTDLASYLSARPDEIVQWTHNNTDQDNISEYIFTGMRKLKGISLLDFQSQFGQEFQLLYPKETEKFLKEGLIEIEGNYLRFTRKGVDLSNRVLSDFV